MKRLGFILLIVGFLALVLPFAAHATTAESCDPGVILPKCTCDGTCTIESFIDLFANLYAFGIHIMIPLGALFIVIGSIILLTASGYSTRIEMGKNIIRQAVTGTIIILLSWVIIDTAIVIITGGTENTVFNKPWYAAFKYTCTGDLRRGCGGSAVATLQDGLRQLGYDTSQSKVMDTKTLAAVAAFQKDIDEKVLKIDATTSCDLGVWKLVFNRPMCVPPNPVYCVEDALIVQSKKLPTSGTADTATQSMATMISGSADATGYRENCTS